MAAFYEPDIRSFRKKFPMIEIKSSRWQESARCSIYCFKNVTHQRPQKGWQHKLSLNIHS